MKGKRKNESLKILLDENIVDIKLLARLKSRASVNVKQIKGEQKGIKDKCVLEIAQKEHRVVITGDKDFKKGKPAKNAGIIYIKNCHLLSIAELQHRIIKTTERVPVLKDYVGKIMKAGENSIEYCDYQGNCKTFLYKS